MKWELKILFPDEKAANKDARNQIIEIFNVSGKAFSNISVKVYQSAKNIY